MNPSWCSQIAALHIVIEQNPQITFCMTNETSQEICGQLFLSSRHQSISGVIVLAKTGKKWLGNIYFSPLQTNVLGLTNIVKLKLTKLFFVASLKLMHLLMSLTYLLTYLFSYLCVFQHLKWEQCLVKVNKSIILKVNYGFCRSYIKAGHYVWSRLIKCGLKKYIERGRETHTHMFRRFWKASATIKWHLLQHP